MNPRSVVVEPARRGLPTSAGDAELNLRTPPERIELAVAVATFGVLLHRYTGSTSVNFDVLLDSTCDGSRQSHIQFHIDRASTLAALIAAIEPALVSASGCVTAKCLIPEELCRYFQIDRSIAANRLITLVFSPHVPEAQVVLRFARGTHDDELIVTLSRHMEELLRLTSQAPLDQLITELPMMSASELHHVLVDLNGPAIDFDRLTIPDAFEAYVRSTPDAPAVKFNDQVITFKALHSRAQEAAGVLQQNGVAIESMVGVYLVDPLATAMTYFAIVMAGGVLVPLDPEWPQARLLEVIQSARLKIIVTTDQLSRNLPAEAVSTLLSGALYADPACRSFVRPALTPDSAAYVVHTSGSTGLPKGVVGLHRTITSAAVTAIPMEKDEVYALSVNLTFGSGVIGLFHPIIQGAAVLLVDPMLAKHLNHLVDAWEHASVTRIVMVPPQLRELCLLKGIKERLQTIRIVILVGAALNAELLPDVYDLFPHAILTNGYTCLEVGTMTTRWESRPNQRRFFLTVGAPRPNIRVHILGPNGSRLPLGMPGEIYVGSADLCRGYLNQPELTSQRFLPNPYDGPSFPRMYRTGDIGRLLPSGELEWLGRIDSQVKVRGVRLELEEIELTLQAHPDVQHAAVVTVPHENDFRLLAYLSPKAGRRLLVSSLRQYLTSRLPSQYIPSLFVITDPIPLTRNGKVDRRNLPPISSSRPELDTPFLTPQNSVEKVIQSIWEQELGFAGIGINDHFLELGGDSFIAMRIAIGIEERISVKVAVALIFDFPSISELAASLSSQPAGLE